MRRRHIGLVSGARCICSMSSPATPTLNCLLQESPHTLRTSSLLPSSSLPSLDIRLSRSLSCCSAGSCGLAPAPGSSPAAAAVAAAAASGSWISRQLMPLGRRRLRYSRPSLGDFSTRQAPSGWEGVWDAASGGIVPPRLEGSFGDRAE